MKIFNHMVSTNMISNCTISVSDINNDKNIYELSMESLKGKPTRIKPRPVIKDDIWITFEIYNNNNLSIELCIDIIYINGVPLWYKLIENLNADKWWSSNIIIRNNFLGYWKILRKYNSAGFTISIIHADNEFKPLTDRVKYELYVTMIYSSPGDHVPGIEWNNRTTRKDTVHNITDLLFRIFLKLILDIWIQKIEYFPVNECLSPYHNPQTFVYQQPLDYNTHCTFLFGELFQEKWQQYGNSNVLLTLDRIYLQSLDKIQDGHETFYGHSHRIIKKQKMI